MIHSHGRLDNLGSVARFLQNVQDGDVDGIDSVKGYLQSRRKYGLRGQIRWGVWDRSGNGIRPEEVSLLITQYIGMDVAYPSVLHGPFSTSRGASITVLRKIIVLVLTGVPNSRLWANPVG